MSRRRRIARRVGILGTWVLALIALIMVASVVAFYTLTNVPRPEDITLPQVATIEYSDGSVMARIGTENRTIVPLSKVPVPVRYAVVAAEDRGFYSEPGVSIKGTLRAAISDLTGGDTQGGSGITQQYVKNAYLNSSRTVSRKLRELAIAVKLSRNYSKDQILEFYLNTVYFGRGAYGIEAAAETYFNETSDKLTTSQGALLAALLKAPSTYDPANDMTASKSRWQYVVDGMVSIKQLTADQAAALTFPATQPPTDQAALGASGPTALVVNRVLAELQADGISQSDIQDKGLHVLTTIDKNAQTDAVNAINATFTNLSPKQANIKNALIAVNPTTGGVLAYYGGPGPGGKNYAGQPDSFDYAGAGCRPPGSSFKPYTLATALTQTLANKPPLYTIKTVVDGRQTVTIDGTQISNDPSDKQYSGMVPIDFAMKVSLNTAFDGLAYAIGPSNVAATAHAAGIEKTCGGVPTLQNADGSTSFGIGIGDYPVHPIDQAIGYATLANGGTANAAYMVQKVTDAKGDQLFEHKAAGTRALDQRVANDTTLTLEPVASFSGVGLGKGRQSAAKTGTEGILTGPDAGQNSDAWMVGYTPQVSTAVWVGSGNSTQAIYNSSGGAEYGRDLPGRAWKAFMDAYLNNQPNQALASKQMILGNGASSSASATATVTTPSSTPTTTHPSSPSTPAAPTTHPTVPSSPSPPPSSASAPPTSAAPPAAPAQPGAAPNP